MITWLTGEQSAAYAHLATEAVAAGLPQVQAPGDAGRSRSGIGHFAAGLCFAGMPAGLAILRREHTHSSAPIHLLSLVVASPLRRLGLGRELLAWVREEGRLLGWGEVSVSYPLDHSCTAAMDRLTSSDEGWVHTAGLQLLQLKRDGAEQLLQELAPAVNRCQRSGRFGISAWRDLPTTIREGLGQQVKAPTWAWPRDDHGQDPLHALDAEISSVLLDRQEAAGWITAHRVGPRLFRVSQWWVQPRLQGSGTALLLLHRGIAGALQSPHGYEIGTFGMEPENTQAIRLCNNKITPFASGISQQRRARLTLSKEESGTIQSL